MTRLARRNKTRWIKLMKKRGFKWLSGRLWSKFTFASLTITLRDDEEE